VATEQSGTTEEEAQNTEVMGAVEATESAEEMRINAAITITRRTATIMMGTIKR